eukprot:1617179-Karenia_brevis.AAC.1
MGDEESLVQRRRRHASANAGAAPASSGHPQHNTNTPQQRRFMRLRPLSAEPRDTELGTSTAARRSVPKTQMGDEESL